MNVSALEEYGLRCAVRLASLEAGKTLSAPEIAEKEGLSVEYVSKFMLLLKRAELVRANRGINGGFALAKPASEISLKAVFEALAGKRQASGRLDDGFCKSFAGKAHTCVRHESCSIRPFWKILTSYVETFTQGMSLADLLKSESETLSKTEAIAQRNVENIKRMREGSARAKPALPTKNLLESEQSV